MSVLFLAFLAYKIFRSHELAFSVILLYISCTAFLLHARQCRYYALVMFAQIWLIYGYWLLLSKGTVLWAVIHIIFALTVQFYSNYMVVFGNVLALSVSAVCAYRKHPGLLRTLPVCLGGFALFTIPWLAYAQPWSQSKHLGLQSFGTNISYYLSGINFHIVPVAVLLIPVVIYAWHLVRKWNDKGSVFHDASVASFGGKVLQCRCKDIEVFLWILVPIHLVVLSVISDVFFRYITTLIPVLVLLAAVILVNYIRLRVIRYPIIALLCLSNVLSIGTGYPFRGSHKPALPLARFICEITSSYEDRLEDVVSYFEQNGGPDESVFTFDNELALIFHTDMRIIDGRFTKDVISTDLPDWILTDSATGIIAYPPVKLPSALLQYYRPVTLTVHNTPPGSSCPDPDLHTSFTASEMTEMVIYKKVRGQAGLFSQ